MAFNDFYNSSAPLNTNKNNYVITCWVIPPVNKDGATGEWQKEKMSFLSTVSFIFSVCSSQPFIHRTATKERCGRREGMEGRDGASRANGTGPHNGSWAPSPFRLPISISPPEHTLLLQPWLLPWWRFVCKLCFSKKGCGHRSWSSLLSKINRRVHTLIHTHNIYRLFW